MLKKRPARRVWALAFGHHEDHTRSHGYEPTREAAMAVGAGARRAAPHAEGRAVRTARSWRGIFANAPSRGRGV